MKIVRCWLLTTLAVTASFGCWGSTFGQDSASAVPEWKFVDIMGREHLPLAVPETKAIVVVFITTDCPIANGYQPELSR